MAEPPDLGMHQDQPSPRSAYKAFFNLPTRWMDNDIYGHVNNVNYYSFFRHGDRPLPDAARWARSVDEQGDRLLRGERLPLSKSHPVFPRPSPQDCVSPGSANQAFRYEIGLFREDDEMTAADGYFVHVFVDRETQTPSPLPDAIREAVSALADQTD